MSSIGDTAIFLQRRSLCISANALPTVVGGTITYSIFDPTGPLLLQYHLGSGSCSLALDRCSLLSTEPGPCSFILHIYTCGSCGLWYVVVHLLSSTLFLLPFFWLWIYSSSYDLLFMCYSVISWFIRICLGVLITGTKDCCVVGWNTLPANGFGGQLNGRSVEGLVACLSIVHFSTNLVHILLFFFHNLMFYFICTVANTVAQGSNVWFSCFLFAGVNN